MRKNATRLLDTLKDWWWVATLLASAIALWGNLPMRTAKLEAGQAKQEEQVSELREWTKETQGFLKGQQALNERLAAQQQAPVPPPPPPKPRTPAPSTAEHVDSHVEELSDDGEIKIMHWTDEDGVVRTMCCHGATCWPWHKQTQCAR